jgi:hypothetical protein
MAATEDELANALIQSHKQIQERYKQQFPTAGDVEAFPEAHYNHFGNRGVADLYVTTGDREGVLYELKSESAVQQATGANEIIRQFNKMREFFFKGSSHSVPRESLSYELCFTPSERNFRHIAENADLYSSTVKQEISNVRCERVGTAITVRPADPDSTTPIVLFNHEDIDFREGVAGTTFPEYAKGGNRKVFDEYEPVIREIAASS